MYYVLNDSTNVRTQPKFQISNFTFFVFNLSLENLRLHQVDHRYLLIRHKAFYKLDLNPHVNHQVEKREILVNHAVENH